MSTWLKFSESRDVSITRHTNCILTSYQLRRDYKNHDRSTCYFSLKTDRRSPESAHVLYENFYLQYTKLTSCLVKSLSISIFSLHIRHLSIYLTVCIYISVNCKRCLKTDTALPSQYIGQTGRTLRERFREHRRGMQYNTDESVPIHFNLPHHTLNDVELIPLLKVRNSRDKIV